MKKKREHQVMNGIEYKYCAKCDTFVDVNNFAKNKNTWDGLHCHCFTCKRKQAKENYTANPDPIKEKSKLWAQENSEKRAQYQKQYRQENEKQLKQDRKIWEQNNQEHMKEYNKLNKRKRRQETEYRLLENLRNRLRRAIRSKKSDSTLNLVGCDVSALKEHLEKLFLIGMSWDNYGEWHIDHIIPCASFDLSKEEEQRKCFHYTNLQPLWAADNLKKATKII
jgi:hypothetical protein